MGWKLPRFNKSAKDASQGDGAARAPVRRRPPPLRRRMFRVVDYYIFSEAFQLYLIGFFGFLAFLIINQLFLEGDRLLNPNFPAREILRLIALNVPYFVTMAIPVAVLFGTMMSMGRLAKDNEIEAMFTNGIHLVRLYLPFLILSLMNVIIVFAVNETLVPRAGAAAEAIYQKYPYLREQEETEVDPIIVKLPNGAFFASSFVDKNTGSTFYAVYDTLTMKSPKEVEGEFPLPLKPEGAKPSGAPGGLAPKAHIMESESRTEGAPPDGAALSSSEMTQPAGHPHEPAPPARMRTGELAPEAQQAAETDDASPAPEKPDEAKMSLVKEQQPERKLFLAANGQISEQMLSVTHPFVYNVTDNGLIADRDERSHMTLRLDIPLKDVFTEIKTPEELSREELQRQTEMKRQLGVNPAKDATDFYLKFSIPFACLFLSLVAMPLSLRAPREERLLGLVITFLLVMSYYTVYYVAKLMGYNEILPPFFAAWMQNLIFAAIAVFIFVVSRK